MLNLPMGMESTTIFSSPFLSLNLYSSMYAKFFCAITGRENKTVRKKQVYFIQVVRCMKLENLHYAANGSNLLNLSPTKSPAICGDFLSV